MKNKHISMIYIILIIIICKIIIFLDLENLGNTLSGGGFFEYGFAIKFNIFIVLVIMIIISLIIKKFINPNINIKLNIILIVIAAIFTYNINIFLFTKVIDRNDFDKDGLSNKYEELIGTNIFKKNNETRRYQIEKPEISNNKLIKYILWGNE